MNIALKIDISNEIFGGKVDASVIKTFTAILDEVLTINGDNIVLRVRNQKGEILKSGSTKYFTVDKKIDTKDPDVIIAGALHQTPYKTKVPSIRFREYNSVCNQVPQKNKFPFTGERKEQWICVEICQGTLPLFKEMLTEEITTFFKTQK